VWGGAEPVGVDEPEPDPHAVSVRAVNITISRLRCTAILMSRLWARKPWLNRESRPTMWRTFGPFAGHVGPWSLGIGTALWWHRGMDEVTPKVTVFLLDDHELVREGVRQLLESDGTIEVVGEAATCVDAVARIRATQPQVAVLDVQLPDGSGVEVCRDVRSMRPDLVCLMLTSFSDEEALFQSVMAGAAGYVLKQIRGNDLVSAVHRVARGESLIDPAVTGQLLDRLRNPRQDEDPRLAALTELERTILDYVAEGLTNRQIANKVNRAEKTVKNYMSSILMKLGMTRRTEAAVFAVRRAAGGVHAVPVGCLIRLSANSAERSNAPRCHVSHRSRSALRHPDDWPARVCCANPAHHCPRDHVVPSRPHRR
jgi:two-component system, NarL family, response regulator DevR